MKSKTQNILKSLEHLDKRWIFLLVAIAVLIPLVIPLEVPLKISTPTQNFYDHIERLPEGSMVLLSSDYDPGSKAELYPMTEATLRHLFRRNLKVVALSLWPAGPPMVELALENILKERGNDKKYGTDYVNLGFKEGREAVMVDMGRSIRVAFPVDYHGTSIAELPLMDRVQNYSSFPLFVNLSVGYPGTKEYVQYAQSRFKLTMITGAGAVSVPEYSAYLQSGQISGMLMGISGCAEYEQLLEEPGLALTFMNAQSAGHVLIILLIIAGNVVYFMVKRGEKK
ncbi:MAG: hypothetical protein P9X24_01855 [Candidatus Hatepunaea meridiana]|nr:hypothetical protein [Candidatus Hatepunaea meridiana]